MIKCFAEHPGLRLFESGHPVIICTDDSLVFRTSTSSETAHAWIHTNYSSEKIRKLHKETRKYGF